MAGVEYMKPEWILSQDELRVSANCHLAEIHPKLDCEHCPSGHYCQDIGYAYQKKLLKHLTQQAQVNDICDGFMITSLFIKELQEMQKQLESEQ
jgi:hypothetical protein